MAENIPTPEGKEPSQPAGQIDVEALLGELKKVNVSSVEELQGKLNASREAGHLANLVGDLRKEIAELKGNVQQPVQRVNLDNVQEGQTINLEDVIGKTVRRELTALEQDKMERQQKVQRAVSEAVTAITSDEDYPLVKEVWEQQMTPDMIFKIQTGQVNPLKLYDQTVKRYLKTVTKKSLDAINMLSGKGNVAAPHVEHGEQVPTNLVSGDKPVPSNVKRLNELKTQVNKGKILSDEEELEMVGLTLSLGGQPRK